MVGTDFSNNRAPEPNFSPTLSVLVMQDICRFSTNGNSYYYYFFLYHVFLCLHSHLHTPSAEIKHENLLRHKLT